eukprot:6401323-Amphidinium_carterae.1
MQLVKAEKAKGGPQRSVRMESYSRPLSHKYPQRSGPTKLHCAEFQKAQADGKLEHLAKTGHSSVPLRMSSHIGCPSKYASLPD